MVENLACFRYTGKPNKYCLPGVGFESLPSAVTYTAFGPTYREYYERYNSKSAKEKTPLSLK